MQVGIIGSSGSLVSDDIINAAQQVGRLLGSLGVCLVIGVEGDCKNLGYYAALGSQQYGVDVIGIGHNAIKPDQERNDVITHYIATGMNRGGGREFIFMNSCDIVICLGGGSGTLNEITIAYQNRIPIVAITGTGGRADKLADSYLDERRKTDSCVKKIIGTSLENFLATVKLLLN